MRPITRTSGSMFYSLIYLNSQRGHGRLKHSEPGNLEQKMERLPGNTKNRLFTRSWTARVWLVHPWADRGGSTPSGRLSGREDIITWSYTRQQKTTEKKSGKSSECTPLWQILQRKDTGSQSLSSKDIAKFFIEKDGILSTIIAAFVLALCSTPVTRPMLYLCDNQALQTAVKRWVGKGGKATLVGALDADILREVIKELRKRTQKQRRFWSK